MLENEWVLGMGLDPEFMGCQREITYNFKLVNSLTADGWELKASATSGPLDQPWVHEVAAGAFVENGGTCVGRIPQLGDPK